ncbi:inosine/xanthosine triphosphatase [Marinomonas epiphytica]
MTQIIRVCVGSLNPVKINAAKEAFSTLFEGKKVITQGMHAPSNVAEQPMSAEETKQGAINRAWHCQNSDEQTQFDFYVAMEAGVDCEEKGAYTFAYMAIIDQNEQLSIGRTASLPLPISIYQRLKSGEELGPVMDDVFGTDNIKQKGGAIGLFTNNHATRGSIYQQAMILALAPYLHPEHYL